jgi:hypothetical protein
MFGVLQRIIGGSLDMDVGYGCWIRMTLNGYCRFFGYGWFFTDPGGSSDLDGWWFFGFG